MRPIYWYIYSIKKNIFFLNFNFYDINIMDGQRDHNYFKMDYSVMQSDGNSIGGDVVSDSFNKTLRDEENILEQIFKSQYGCINIIMILILYNIIRKCLLTLQ